MRFYVSRAGDEGSGRVADTLQFVNGTGVTYSVAVATSADFKSTVTIVGSNGERHELDDPDDAGRQVARLLVLCRDQSLLVTSTRGTTGRGDELTAADVYPPHAHPRVKVQGR